MDKARYGPFPFVPPRERPRLAWPGGARLALWVIPNIEYFVFDYGMPGDENQRPNPNPPNPDVRRWSQREYGNRAGVWRLMEVLARHGIRGTVALNALVCDTHPQVVRACLELGWEFMGHGRSNSRRLTEVADAGAEIRDVYARIEAFTGKRPVGWLGAGLEETWDTLDHLIAAGALYVADWICDDQPFVMTVNGKRIVSLPYSFECNDINFVYRKFEPAVFERNLRDQFDTLYREGAATGKVMAICLHPWVIGIPHRIGYLDRALDYICAHEGVWLATGEEIVRHYLASGAAA
ncbi:MAG: polysaccharide deacetylase family protein [Proteobacteria bacterium]|nr:polysaccharide deacetylase family protein [Pseudomonadota bacterium]